MKDSEFIVKQSTVSPFGANLTLKVYNFSLICPITMPPSDAAEANILPHILYYL